jgi:uncharacterized membrane protein
MPALKPAFVVWKFVSALAFAMLVLLAPVIRVAMLAPRKLPALLVGIAFTVAMATLLGIASANPKTFIVVFLSFWYLVMNDAAHTPSLDFAGFGGIATPLVTAGYLAGALAAVTAATLLHGERLKRT